MHRAFGAMAGVAREIALGTEARELVCMAALTSLNATMATVIEPRESGFTITGSAGIPLDRSQIRRVEPVASLQAFHTRRRIFVPNAAQDSRVDQTIVRSTGLESIVYEPILRDGESVGVLAVGWDSHRVVVDAKTDAIMRFLAAEAGASIERADLLAQLRRARAQRPADRARQPPHLERRDHERDARPDCALRRDDRSRPLQAVQRRVRPRRRRPAPESQRGSVAEPSAQRRRPCPDRRRGVRRPASEMLRSRRCRRPRATAPGHPQRGDGVDRRRGSLPGEDPNDLLARADAALYEAKSAGRDRLLLGRVERDFGREADRAVVRCPALDRRGGASAVRIVRGCPGRTASTGPPRWACAARRWRCTRSSSAPASPSRAGRRASRRCATALHLSPREPRPRCCSRSRPARSSSMPLAGMVVARLGAARTIAVMAFSPPPASRPRRSATRSASPRSSSGSSCSASGNGTWDVAMNVEGAFVEQRLGRSIMPRFHAGFSIGTVAGALLGAAMVAARRLRHGAPPARRGRWWRRRPAGRARLPRRSRRPPITTTRRAPSARGLDGAAHARCSASSCSAWRSSRARATTGSASP